MDVPDGVQKKRLSEHNPREVAFAEQWKKEHENENNRSYLWHLLTTPSSRGEVGAIYDLGGCIGSGYIAQPIGPPDARDQVVAATVIQWLGTNVGMCFLEQALKRCGYKIERT